MPLLEDELQVNVLSACLPNSDVKLNAFKKETTANEELKLVMSLVQTGWCTKIQRVPADIRIYWTFREQLTCSGGLLFKSSRVDIAQSLRSVMLNRVHESHLGIVKCKEMARDSGVGRDTSVGLSNY